MTVDRLTADLSGLLERAEPEDQQVLVSLLELAAAARLASDEPEVVGFAQLDTLAEMGTGLRLQQAMVDYTQAQAVASNILKAHAQTSSSVVRNLRG